MSTENPSAEVTTLDYIQMIEAQASFPIELMSWSPAGQILAFYDGYLIDVMVCDQFGHIEVRGSDPGGFRLHADWFRKCPSPEVVGRTVNRLIDLMTRSDAPKFDKMPDMGALRDAEFVNPA